MASKNLENRKMFKKNGDKLEEVLVEEGQFQNFNVFGIYFGAKSCSSCVKFTPILKDFYEKLKAKDESFEVVYFSSDKTEEEMKEFVLDSHGDWFVFWKDESDEEGENFQFNWVFREALGINGIPKLFVTKNDDKELASTKGVTDVLSKGEEAFEEWKNKTYIYPGEEGYEAEKEEPFEDTQITPKCCKISKFKPWEATSPADLLAGLTLIKKNDNEFMEEPAEAAVNDVELVGFYFSASWCPPCHAFTPKLKEFYDDVKSNNQSFELVFISSDSSEEGMKKYMQELHGNWFATPYDESFKSQLQRKFAVEGIPSLGIVNKKGEMVVSDAYGDVLIKKSDAIDFWLEGKEATTLEERQEYWEKEYEAEKEEEEEKEKNENEEEEEEKEKNENEEEEEEKEKNENEEEEEEKEKNENEEKETSEEKNENEGNETSEEKTENKENEEAGEEKDDA